MAKQYVFSIFDSAVGAFMRPFFVPSRGAALRMFGDESIREAADNPIYAHPADYSLHLLGYFEDGDGTLESIYPPERVCNASDFRASPEVIN